MTVQQEMFQAICDVFGWDPALATKSAKTRIGKVGRELREVGATPEQVRSAREVLDEMFEHTTYGPEAIALWWQEIVNRYQAKERRQRRLEEAREEYPEPTPEELAANRRRWKEMVESLGLGKTEDALSGMPE